MADVKLFHKIPEHLRHGVADEFAQFAWDVDFKLPENQGTGVDFKLPESQGTADNVFDSKQLVGVCSRLRVFEPWEYKGRYASGGESNRVSENTMLETFTPLKVIRSGRTWVEDRSCRGRSSTTAVDTGE